MDTDGLELSCLDQLSESVNRNANFGMLILDHLLGVLNYFGSFTHRLDVRTQKPCPEAERQRPLQKGRWTTLHRPYDRGLYFYKNAHNIITFHLG